MGVLRGIDIGSSGTNAVLATPGGKVRAHEPIGLDISLPRPGWAEVDAPRLRS